MVASVFSGFVGAFLALVLIGTLAVAAGYLLYRSAKRRWRLLRDHVMMRTAMATWDGTQAVRYRRTKVSASQQWSRAKTRREMWRAVGAADKALAHAVEVGAPVADLPSLGRRLHQSACELDRLLALDAGGAPLRSHVDQLLSAASDIQLAAVNAAGDMAAPAVRSLAADAEREFRAIAEGLSRSRAVTVTP